MSASPFSLGALDDPRPFTPRRQTWEQNLAALAAAQPAYAAQLRAAPLPSTWRPVLGLDDFPTWRVEAPGAAPEWLAGSALPLVRARSRLEGFNPSGKNPALACLGTAAEVRVLLDRLPAFHALFVFETELSVVAAALRLHELAREIEAGRLVLVPADREREFLAALLAAHPGLEPPGDVLLTDLVPSGRVEVLRAVGETIHRETAEARARRLEVLRTAPPRSLPTAGPVRFAALGLAPEREGQEQAGALVHAARRLGWPAECARTSDSRHLHPLAHCEGLAAFGPELLLAVNHPPGWLPVPLAHTRCAWYLDERAVTDRASEDHDGPWLLAASPRVATALRNQYPASERVRLWPWACTAETEPTSAAPADANAPVLLVADCPDRAAERNAIVHSSHRRIWEEAARAVEQAWEQPLAADPQRLLAAVERHVGLELRDPEIRDTFLRSLTQVLLPAITAEQVARGIVAAGRPVLALGRGWARAAVEGVTPAGRDLWHGSEGRGPHAAACVVVAGDPLGPALLHAAARGWPVILHSPGGDRGVVHALGGVLTGEHVRVFGGTADLWAALEFATGPEGRVRAGRAQAHVLARHTYEHRLAELLGWVRSGDGPSEELP